MNPNSKPEAFKVAETGAEIVSVSPYWLEFLQ